MVKSEWLKVTLSLFSQLENPNIYYFSFPPKTKVNCPFSVSFVFGLGTKEELYYICVGKHNQHYVTNEKFSKATLRKVHENEFTIIDPDLNLLINFINSLPIIDPMGVFDKINLSIIDLVMSEIDLEAIFKPEILEKIKPEIRSILVLEYFLFSRYFSKLQNLCKIDGKIKITKLKPYLKLVDESLLIKYIATRSEDFILFKNEIAPMDEKDINILDDLIRIINNAYAYGRIVLQSNRFQKFQQHCLNLISKLDESGSIEDIKENLSKKLLRNIRKTLVGVL